MYNHDKVTQKLNDLYWKVHGTVDKPPEGGDLLWCRTILEDVRDSGLIPNKEQFQKANLLWKKYSNGVEPTNEDMWELIDELLTQETPSKIGAIKTYRRFTNSNLRDAKDVIDAREQKIKRGW